MTPLPCPFCGKIPVVRPVKPNVEGNTWGEVKCINYACPAMPSVLDGERVADKRGSEAYKQAAIKRWNTRA